MSRIVLKLGGRVAAEAAATAHALRAEGYEVVVVHGAGPQITEELERRGIEARFVDGRRVTTAEVLEVVRGSLAEVNDEVCRAIGRAAVGLSGDVIGLLAAHVEVLGLVGDPKPTAPAAVLDALAAGAIPVVVPLARGTDGVGVLNVNADEAAAALAIGIGADQILFVSDVPGVLLDGAVIERLPADDAARMLDEGSFQGGIVPKLEAALTALQGGVRARIGSTEVVAA